MRLRLEFTTEPFDLEEPPEHARMARELVESAPLDRVEVGPFGNTVEGGAGAVLEVVDRLLRAAPAAGAHRISLQVTVVDGVAAAEGEDG
ncbi:hypothetical protein GCM10027160_38600 [Streptomyces calidiresistens]|uniref:Thiamine-binding protein domain-containing protein n=1 Tax=Streptomyces calidiresistens TaxID=1485586 RepID=A0A7W3XX11_9ACTN|nr:hypothetical protein [Streptomyces calidiresistens]MBB0230439.1 hypothetical protein [Streptomyces calidiresistens]